MMVRGVRGATTVGSDDEAEILQATQQLLERIIAANGIEEQDVASVLFTTTPDLTACYPAKAARIMGWQQVALMGFQEMAVPQGLERCIRVLIHWNTTKPQVEIDHIFMNGAVALRPDLQKHEPLTED